MPVNQVELMDGEARAALVQITQTITAQADTITTQATRECSPRENPYSTTLASTLRDFTRMNPPVYFRSRTNEYPQEFVNDVHKILCSMGVNEKEKVELAAY